MALGEEVRVVSDFGERLRRIRTEKGLSQEDLANTLGITQAAISQLESGRRVATPKTVMRLAEALQTDIEDLAGEDEGDFELKALMRTAKGVSPQTIRRVTELLELAKRGEKGPR